MGTTRCFVLSVLLILVVQHGVVCKRSGSSGKQRTTARTTPRTTHHQTNPPPSAPVVPQQNNPIGFDNVNRQSANQPIGFENRAPLGNQAPPNVGFNNGYHPPQSQVPPGGWNQPTSGYNPGYHPPQSQVPPGGYNPPGWNHPTSGYNPGYNPPGGYAPHGGGYNPPGSYYNNFATPGVQPQFYQPPQQSGGIGAGTLLGVAGGFGGGYLLGRLTGGGHDSKEKDNAGKPNQQEFVVHHYYHNGQEVPKQIVVANDSLVSCAQNVTQNLCVPNTFAMCFSNGTIMCVTHTRFTVPCGTNTSMACIITALPCSKKDKSCNTASNLSSTVVYVPCISNVTITGQNDTLGNGELCITALAEPVKKLGSPVPSLFNLLSVFATLPFQLQQSMNFSGTASLTPMDINTTMPPSKVSDG